MKSRSPRLLKRRETIVHKGKHRRRTATRRPVLTARLETRIKELRLTASRWVKAHWRSESEKVQASLGVLTRGSPLTELSGVNPKGGDLCVTKAKPVERLVEACSSIDVQIIYSSCVKGRKTHRTTK